MPTQSEDCGSATSELEERQLCISCIFPNEADAHFCSKCGAPLSSYSATGPFELLFAEGHVYRQAAERPRKFVVVLGVWVIFGCMAMAGAALLAVSNVELVPSLFGSGALLISVVVILKSTRNYFLRPKPQLESAE